MSWQQVNLYLPEFKPKTEVLSFNTAFIVCAVTCLLLAAFSVLGTVENRALYQSTQEIQLKLVTQDQDISRIKAALPRSQAALVQQEVDGLRLALERRQRIYQLISQQNLGNSDGFSSQLSALARQYQKNISVERFQIVAGGAEFNFSGKATSAQAVPQYLQRLQTEPSFDNTRFGHLVLERSPNGVITFSLSRETQISKAGR
ncbi:hypothetical protein R50072_22230 [Simiduia litorea]|uniref:PilN domain-containing protein n=1 Tax=Simiduia litorea TaxID=1435348 RepID=UPI0036F24175